MTPAPERHRGDSVDGDLTPVLGSNLRRIRERRGLSLERLARASGVSRAMLSQVELGRSTPTINVLWRIARALDLPFAALISPSGDRATTVLRQANAKLLTNAGGRFTSRALFPCSDPRRVEFYELRIAPGTTERAAAHAPGTTENLVVASGEMVIEVGGSRTGLGAGDAIRFEADVPHSYVNVNASRREATLYPVMAYAETVG